MWYKNIKGQARWLSSLLINKNGMLCWITCTVRLPLFKTSALTGGRTRDNSVRSSRCCGYDESSQNRHHSSKEQRKPATLGARQMNEPRASHCNQLNENGKYNNCSESTRSNKHYTRRCANRMMKKKTPQPQRWCMGQAVWSETEEHNTVLRNSNQNSPNSPSKSMH